jgi:hypothetical protein
MDIEIGLGRTDCEDTNTLFQWWTCFWWVSLDQVNKYLPSESVPLSEGRRLL